MRSQTTNASESTKNIFDPAFVDLDKFVASDRYMKSILQKILAVLARATIRKYKPIIIGITGSVGKTSTREAIFAVLKKRYLVRQGKKSFNTEIGFPLAILGMDYYHKKIWKWLSAIFGAAFRIYFSREKYPEMLILEYGVEYPRDMDYLLSIAKPNIAVVTAIGDVPVHVEFFKDPEEVIVEKAKLVTAVPDGGYVILNHDDYAVYDMKDKTKAKVLTFGFEEHANLRIMNYELRITKDEKSGDIPEGISFKIQHKGNTVPFRMSGAFGEPQAYAVAAAAAVGIALGLNLVEISEAIKDYAPPAGRLRLIKGIKNSFILDDTYNAAPEAMRAALDTLKSLPGKRKIAILGDMLEIGKYTEQVHRAMGDRVAGFVDLLITVGPRAKFIADEALSRGVEPHAGRLEASQIFKFDDSESAGRALDPMIQPGDLILVKGSQSMRMEKVVEEIMAHPERTGGLLVRQDEYWKAR